MRTLTRAERFALQLLACGLNTPELAHAMSWTIAETQVFCNGVRRMLASPKTWTRRCGNGDSSCAALRIK